MRSSAFVFDVVSWLGPSTVITFGDVDFCFVDLVLMTGRDFDIDLGFRVALIRLLIAILSEEMSVMARKESRTNVTGSTKLVLS